MPFFIVSVFDNIAEYAPGFKDSIAGYDILTPPDLERIFGLTGGVRYRHVLALLCNFSLRFFFFLIYILGWFCF